MLKQIFTALVSLCLSAFLQASSFPENPYAQQFQVAYLQYPNIPKGFLEAYAHHNTRITLIDTSQAPCNAMPQAYGVMGIYFDGKNYFQENGKMMAQFSGFSKAQLLQNPQHEILAFAAYYSAQLAAHASAITPIQKLKILSSISEIPSDQSLINDFARQSMEWEWVKFLNNGEAAVNYGFEKYGIDPIAYFGAENVQVLESDLIYVHPEYVVNQQGDSLQLLKSADYTPALWVAAPSCNFGSRNGTAVSAVTLHTVQGTYAGCISWFGNCNAGVSAHYVLRSSDGQVTQMVLESSRAFHVGSENPYTIGLEHEGYVNNAAWYTTAMYQGSANLVKDIIASGYGIPAIRTSWFPWSASTNYNASSIPGACVRVKGHQHYPNQTHTDPGANWNWDYFFKLVHPTPTATVFTSLSGNFTDSGNSGNYSNDERSIWTISPSNALSVTLNFSSFSLENNWDYLYIYNGNSINAPLLGIFTGSNIPPTLVANSGSMTVEFRSDCATTFPGWEAQWTSQIAGPIIPPDIMNPVTQILNNNDWIVRDTLLHFTESDSGSGLKQAYYNVLYAEQNQWKGLANKGFMFDDFDQNSINSSWQSYSGLWTSTGQYLMQSDESENNTNISAALNQNLNSSFLYHFSAAYTGAGANKRFGFHFMCDSVQKLNRGNSYFIWYRDAGQELEIYKVTNDLFSLVYDTSLSLVPAQFYDFKVSYDKQSGQMRVWVNNQKVAQYTDANPIQIGNGISFRTGNAMMQVSQFETFVGRPSNQNIALHIGIGSEVPFENASPSLPAAWVKSIVEDQVGNLGSHQRYLNVDFTRPLAPLYAHDMNLQDLDTAVFVNNSAFTAYWSAAKDTNSGIADYYMYAGTSPQGNDILSVQTVGSVLSYTLSSSLQANMMYYFSIYAQNNAGLNSDTVHSDGFMSILGFGLDDKVDAQFELYPNPSTGYFSVKGIEESCRYTIVDMYGKVIEMGELSPHEIKWVRSELKSSTYLLLIEHKGKREVHRWVVKK